jgi:steroid 5-alpha reductase family enzyme
VNPIPWDLLLGAWAAAAALQLGAWLVQLRTRNAGIVDAMWASSIGLIGLGYALFADGDPLRRLLIGAIVGLWGVRLGGHLWVDRVIGQPEEGRYVRLREIWGARADLHLLWFFQAQALLAAALSLPFAFAARDPSSFPRWFDLAAMIVWIIGWVGESVADRQLRAWKRDPANKGRTCRRGLWRTSRHPNYFFEWLMWCAFALAGLGSATGWLGGFSPALILFLVLKVTGIPPTEAQALRSRGDDYRHYQRTTSAFFPWPPREVSP